MPFYKREVYRGMKMDVYWFGGEFRDWQVVKKIWILVTFLFYDYISYQQVNTGTQKKELSSPGGMSWIGRWKKLVVFERVESKNALKVK